MLRFLKNTFIYLFLGICALLALLIIAFFIMRNFLGYGFYSIPSEAMRPNIITSDFILAPPIKQHDELKRGDIVFFRHENTIYVKRIIGMPNENIQIINGMVYLNNNPFKYKKIGQEIASLEGNNITLTKLIETNKDGRSYEVLDTFEDGQYDNTMVFKLKADEYFMMGDNRDNSLDSRADKFLENGIGYVNRKNIIHKDSKILFSIEINQKNIFESKINKDRLFKTIN